PPPLVQHIGLALHVLRSVGELHQAETVPLVEAARLSVLLEDPRPKPVGTLRHRPLEELRADAASLRVRVDVDVIEHVRPERREPVDPVFRLGNPSLAILEDPDSETWTILV